MVRSRGIKHVERMLCCEHCEKVVSLISDLAREYIYYNIVENKDGK